MAKAKTKTKAAMTRDEFWAEVARIGWGAKTTDHRAVKIGQLRQGEAHCDGMREHFQAVSSALIDSGCDLHGGDSADDCRNHIIGLGKEEYHLVLLDLTLGERRYKKGDYKESFAYCIPYDSDFKDLKPERFTEWAERAIEDLEQDSAGVREADRKLAQTIDRVLGVLQFIKEGDFDAALEVEDEIRGKVQRIKEDWSALVKRLGGELNWSEWLVLNLFSDLRKRAEVLA